MDNLGETLESSKRWPLPRQSRQQKTVLRPRVGNQLADPDTEHTGPQAQVGFLKCHKHSDHAKNFVGPLEKF